MNEVLRIIVISAVCVVTGGFLGCAAVYVFNHMPSKWLCDYGEEPTERVVCTGTQRLRGGHWKYIFSACFIAIGIYLAVSDPAYALTVSLVIWALLVIAIADAKYGIIPDQYVIFIAVLSIPMIVYTGSVREMMLGLALGGGAMLIAAIAGRIITRADALGFGDVKLMAACGLCLGLVQTAFVLALTAIASAVFACIGLARGRFKKGDAFPLGPFICAAAACVLVFAPAFS